MSTSADPPSRPPPLTVVTGAPLAPRAVARERGGAGATTSAAHELDWSIFMARAQAGDRMAYRRLLGAITPYLRSLAERCHRDPSDVEDAVQDVLLTVHAIRYTYDPTRPFGPWLVTIANYRFVDRLRRQTRLRARETVLTPEHETFPASQSNLDNELSDRRELEEAVENLPAGQRQAIRLLKLKELSLKEASAASGMSIASLKAATHRALKSLRNMLSNRSGT